MHLKFRAFMKRSKLKFKTCFMPKTYDFTGKNGTENNILLYMVYNINN